MILSRNFLKDYVDIDENIDIKTLDTVGNSGDIRNIQFENNQSSFENLNLDIDPTIPNSGVKVECLLPKEYSYNGEPPLPMLTYFFTIIYSDNGQSFKLNRDENYQTIYLKCLPNGFTSPLFDNDIVDNFKTYSYLKAANGFPPVYLTDDASDVNNKIAEFVANHPGYININGRSKKGAFNPNQIHPKYNTNGVSWFPVSRKDNVNNTYHFYLEAVYKGNTNRINNDKIKNRYDSEGNLWLGVRTFLIID